MAAAGLPIALLLGVVADLAAGLIRDRRPLAAPGAALAELRRMASVAPPLHPLRVGGAAVALFGASLAGAASVGAFPGSFALVYLSLVLAAGGGVVCLLADGPVRPAAWLVEPAIAIGLGAGFLRWAADDLKAIRGAHAVLGTGFEVGPPLASAALFLAVVALLAAGAIRGGAYEGPGLWRAVCRWALDGAIVLAAAGLVAGLDLRGGTRGLAAAIGTAIGTAALLGILRVGLARLPPALGRWTPGAVVLVAVLAAAIVGLA